MSVFNYFLDEVDRVYCIHDTTSEVRKEILEELKDLNPKYVYAKTPHPSVKINSFQYRGVFGNTLSHLKVLTDAYISNYKNTIIIFEDDIELRKDIDIQIILKNSATYLPDDWVTLYLTGNPGMKLELVHNQLYKCEYILGAFAYAINCKYLEELLFYYIDQIGQEFPRCICDNIIKNFTREYKKVPQYCLYPFIVNHKRGLAIAREGAARNFDQTWFEERYRVNL
jgi:GR25 family glycosyltransferase involved in LPS biosynthesis